MAAKDRFHDNVRCALEKEQWVVVDEPLMIPYGDVNFQIDLAADRLLLAERGTEKIAVEIKSFLNPSAITDFYGALGQFLSYRLALREAQPDRVLFLAVPVDTFDSFFQLRFTQLAIKEYGLKLIIYDSTREEITQWIG